TSSSLLPERVGGGSTWNVLCSRRGQHEKPARDRLCLDLLRGSLGGARIHHRLPNGGELRSVEPGGSSPVGTSANSVATRRGLAREQGGERAGHPLRRPGPTAGRQR